MTVPRQPIPLEKIGEVIANLEPAEQRIFRFMLLTGVRCCEARLLLVGDILDPAGNYRQHFVTLHETKGGHPRNIPITPQLIALLEECREAYGGTWYPKWFYGDIDICVFRPGRSNGSQWRPWKKSTNPTRRIRNADISRKYRQGPLGYKYDYIRYRFNEAFRIAGLYGPHTTHGLRKTFAMMVLEAVDEQGRTANDVYTLKELLGHKDIGSTMKYLSGISTDKALRAVDAAYRSAGIPEAIPLFDVTKEPAPLLKKLERRSLPRPEPKPPVPDPGVELY